jgi:hypothetical protein
MRASYDDRPPRSKLSKTTLNRDLPGLSKQASLFTPGHVTPHIRPRPHLANANASTGALLRCPCLFTTPQHLQALSGGYMPRGKRPR